MTQAEKAAALSTIKVNKLQKQTEKIFLRLIKSESKFDTYG